MGLDFPAPVDGWVFRSDGNIPSFIKAAAPDPWWYRKTGAASRKNYVGNAAMMVNQYGSASGQLATATNYTIDQWVQRWALTGGATVAANLSVNSAWPEACNLIYFQVGTPKPTLAAGDYVLFEHRIEGQKVIDLQWGAGGRPVVLRFTMAAPAGTYAVKLSNADFTRSWYTTFVASTGFKTYTIPINPPTDGTWDTGTGVGLRIEWVVAAGSAFADSSDRSRQWLTGNFYCPPGGINNIAAVSGNIHLLAVGLYSDNNNWTGIAPPFEHQPYDEALAECQRYLQKLYSLRGVSIGATSARLQGMPFVPMRVAPSLAIIGSPQTYDGGSTGVISAINANYGNELFHHIQVTTASGLTAGRLTTMLRADANYLLADARL